MCRPYAAVLRGSDAITKMNTKPGEQTTKKERARRARRRENGMAITAGVSKKPAEPLTRSMSLLRAALAVWEAKHGSTPLRSVWKRQAASE